MSNFFSGIVALLTGNTASKALDIVLEKTVDVDKRNALVMQFLTMKEETRRAELARTTIPWVDAVHKMGRQIFWLATTTGVLVLIGIGRGEELLRYASVLDTSVLGGALYTLLKGKGR